MFFPHVIQVTDEFVHSVYRAGCGSGMGWVKGQFPSPAGVAAGIFF
jgi:hypothetical protein